MADGKKDSDGFDKCFRYYEKAIEGMRFHYKDYNASVNSCSIFTGALFVGFCVLYSKAAPAVLLIVCALGFVCAVCWHHCVRGHYHWMSSRINAVYKYEEKLAKFDGRGEAYFAYDVYLPEKDADFFQQNVSPKKGMVLFTFAIIVAWGGLLIYQCGEYMRLFRFCYFGSTSGYTALSVGVVTLVLVAVYFVVGTLHSDTHKMKDAISEGK